MPQEFSLTRAEYFSAQTLYAQRNFRRLWWAWLLLFLAITLWLQRDRIGAPGYLWLVAALLGVGVALVAVLGLVLPRVLALMMVLTVWRRQPVLQAPVSVEISDAGIRGLVIHNPRATRVHLKADEGGLRSYGSWDGFRHKDRSGPLPVPSMLYYTARYHSPRQRREDLFLGLVNGMVPYHLKRRATPGQWARFALVELVNLPSTRRRVRRSQSLARAMVAEGPRIPELRG